MPVIQGSLVLVADVDEAERDARVRTLRRAGCEVIEAATGREALRLAAESGAQLVVLGTDLSDLDPREACRRLRDDPRTAAAAIVRLSREAEWAGLSSDSAEDDADAVLAEPVEASALAATVTALLRAGRTAEALGEALAREHAALVAVDAANRARDDFLSRLSHELRSPLGASLAWVTLLRTSRVDEHQMARGLEAIERSTRQQVRLIEEILDVSRMLSGRLEMERASVDLAAVVQAAVDDVRPAAEAKSIRLEAAIAPVAGSVVGDAARLRRAVSHLVANAVKFTPEGGRVDVSLVDAGSRAEVRVVDTGCGIARTLLGSIAERLRSGAAAWSGGSEAGLGLGLVVAGHVAARHGGGVDVESAGPNRGATFTLHVPIGSGVAAEPAVRPRSGRPEAERSALAGVRVLVVDDERDAREAVSAVLAGCGARVIAAGSAAEALACLAKDPLDVVLSDVAMPVEDGYQLVAAVRRLPSEGAGGLPVLAFSAHAGADERRRILAAGFDEFLVKPMEADELVAAVARWTGRRHA